MLIDCYDGDTCEFDVPRHDPLLGTLIHKAVKVRLADIDTPELRKNKCQAERDLGLKARARLLELLKGAGRIDMLAIKRGHYGRVIARLLADGQDVGAILLTEGLARRYQGKREAWC